jgi:hypothetical protein
VLSDLANPESVRKGGGSYTSNTERQYVNLFEVTIGINEGLSKMGYEQKFPTLNYDAASVMAHEAAGHAYDLIYGYGGHPPVPQPRTPSYEANPVLFENLVRGAHPLIDNGLRPFYDDGLVTPYP